MLINLDPITISWYPFCSEAFINLTDQAETFFYPFAESDFYITLEQVSKLPTLPVFALSFITLPFNLLSYIEDHIVDKVHESHRIFLVVY